MIAFIAKYHGWNDGIDPKHAVPEYEQNLVHLIKDLRRATPGVPVLVLTVARDPDLYSWVRSMGADEMISKDASIDEILAAIRLLLRR